MGLSDDRRFPSPRPLLLRSRTTLVPVDIRVVDLSGKPVADLKQGDFTVKEDGIPQEIRLFDAHALTRRQLRDLPVEGRQLHAARRGDGGAQGRQGDRLRLHRDLTGTALVMIPGR